MDTRKDAAQFVLSEAEREALRLWCIGEAHGEMETACGWDPSEDADCDEAISCARKGLRLLLRARALRVPK